MRFSADQGGTRRRRVPPARSERGAVTAEFAAVLPVMVAVVLGVVWVFGVAVTQLRLSEAAREVARSAARGDADPAAVGRRIAPSGAAIDVTEAGATVEVRVSVDFAGPGGLFALLPGLPLSAETVAARER